MKLDLQFILSKAPNRAAADNGKKLSSSGSFSSLKKTEDGTLYWAECEGSGRNPYRVSIDWSNPDEPVCRCTCPSRQFPCKHALGLMFEQLEGKKFEVADIPQDIAEKRAKQAARVLKKESETSKPKNVNTSALKKKLTQQLEGLCVAEKMVNDLLNSGLGTLSGTAAKNFEKLASELGNSYLTGPQISFMRIAFLVHKIQNNPESSDSLYAEVLRILVALRSTIKKSKVFLSDKINDENLMLDDSVLFEALGGIWKLEDLKAIGSYKENASIVQLAFDASFDEVKKEYVERGWWIDLNDGKIYQSLNLRPLKALKHIPGDDSSFDLLKVPELYIYPGEGNNRIRWEKHESVDLSEKDYTKVLALSYESIVAAVKRTKEIIKNTLAPKYYAVLVPIKRVGMVKDKFVLEDQSGDRIVLKDRVEDVYGHPYTEGLSMLKEELVEGNSIFGLMYYDEKDKAIYLHPYSIVEKDRIVRLKF